MADEKAQEYLRVADGLFNANSATRLQWQRVVRKVLPGLLPPASLNENNADGRSRRCSDAAQAVLKLASWHSNSLTPIGVPWFRFSPHLAFTMQMSDSDKARDLLWWGKVSDIAQDVIERSNFYSQMIPVFIDRCATGGGLLFSEMVNNRFVARHIPAGTYAIAKDANQQLSTVARKYVLTADQMAKEFGEGALPDSVRQELGEDARRFTSTHEIVHLVLPRAASNGSYLDVLQEAMPFRSVYIDRTSGKILKEGGYYEMPYMYTGFLIYGNQVYGTSPLLEVEDAIDDLIALDECALTVAQRSAIPSVIVPPDMVGQVDFRAGGQTVVPIQYLNSDVPRTWAEPTDPRVVLMQRENLKNIVDSALFLPMFEAVSRVDRTMSATEASLREQEAVMTFTQSFTLCVADMRTFLQRLFALLLRAGMLPTEDVPSYLVDVVGGDNYLNYPMVQFNGKMAQAFERNQSNGAELAVTKLVQLGNVLQNPKLTMIFDWDKFARRIALSSGMPSDLMLSASKVDAMYQELVEQRSQQMNAESALQASEADSNAAQADLARAKAQNLF